MRELTEILDEIAEGPAIRFAAIVSRDGFIIANSSSAGQTDELAAAQAAQLWFAADELGEELDGVSTRQIVIKYQSGLVVIDCFNSDAVLLTVVTSESSMAWVQFAVKKHLPEISEKLSMNKQVEA